MNVPNEETELIFDADIITYSKGFKHEDTEEWGIVESDIDRWIAEFFQKFGTYNYILYLTGKGNFREQVAVTHKYKGNRVKPKPKWHKDIVQYLVHCHKTQMVEGMEADDAIAMHLTSNPNSIHIGIDKDLLQVEGWHYRYATHNSPEVPLRWISNEGFLELQQHAKKKKLVGGGYPWFYSQMLLGDTTDNIIAAKGYGDVKTYETLKDCKTEKEYYDAVKAVYDENFEDSDARLRENADLLWMCRAKDSDGELIKWEIPNGNI